MMADTILLTISISGFLILLLYIAIRPTKFSKKRILLFITISLSAIVSLFIYTGINKIKSDISRIIHNSSPKSSNEVYTLLFKKPLAGCMTVINFQDQVIPKIDCCIWMELNLCPSELSRIISLKKYQATLYTKSDSLNFLNHFGGKPHWWTPQLLGDRLNKLTIKFNADNQQTLFFGKDSSHVYLCDQAL